MPIDGLLKVLIAVGEMEAPPRRSSPMPLIVLAIAALFVIAMFTNAQR